MKTFNVFREDLASGRPAKKPVSSLKLKGMNRANSNKSLLLGKLGEEKEDTCSCCDSPIDSSGACGCDSSCKHCGGQHSTGDVASVSQVKGMNELSNKTLANYTRKAVSPLSKKSVGNLASKGAHKLAHSDDFDAGEKEDAKSFQRAKGVIRATKTLAKRASANESALDEVSNELVKKVAHKRNQNVSMAGSKADYDRRDPNYQDAAKKQDRNQKLRFARGAKAIGKVRNESARDNYDPEISDKRTKEKLKKAGLPPESPKVMEAKKPIVHSTKSDSLKTVKIKYNGPPIKTKITNIGPGGKETVQKDWSEGYNIKDMAADLKPKVKPSNKPVPKHLQNQIASQFKDPKDKRIGESYPKKLKNTGFKKTVSSGPLTAKEVKDGDIRARNKVEEQKQLVINLNQNESLANLVRRGVGKVRDAIDSAEKNTGYKVDPKANSTYNPMSGKNIAKRVSQKKR